MLTSALRAIFNKLFLKSFDTTFKRKIKIFLKKVKFFFKISHKRFLKIYPKLILKLNGATQTYPI